MLERNFLGKAIYPKTLKQREYINALESHDIVLELVLLVQVKPI